MSGSRFLSRRTVLRGVCGSALLGVGLPPLEAMFNNHGTAYADGTTIRRFGVWYFGGGVYLSSGDAGQLGDFHPTGSGTAWQPSYQTEPLADPAIKSKVNILARLSTGYGGDPGVSHNIHHVVALAGTGNPGQRIGEGAANAPSIDQAIAADFSARGYRSATGEDFVGAQCSFGGHAGKASFNANGNVVPLETNPKALFDRLFARCMNGTPDPMQPPPTMDQRAAQKLLIVDAIRNDANALKRRVSVNDRARIESHLQAIDALERRLLREQEEVPVPTAGCGCPNRPTVNGPQVANPVDYNDGDEYGTEQSPRQAHRPMADIMAMALACDVTRVFSLEFLGTQTNAVLRDVAGVTESHHMGLTHVNSPKLKETTRYVMEELAYFAKALNSIDEGAGTVLDNTAIYCTSEMVSASAHVIAAATAITLGGGGGALKTGQFIDADSGSSRGDVMYTLAKAVGAEIAGVGANGSAGYSNKVYAPIWR